MYVDHNVLQIDDRNMQDHRYLRSFSQRYGLLFSPPGHGISHYVHLERFARPGELLLGADSHTTMAGAVGHVRDRGGRAGGRRCDGRLRLRPALPADRRSRAHRPAAAGVEAKDVILELLRRHGVRGGRGAVFEFFGDGVATIPTAGRATICNMVVETGATAGVFPADDETRRWLATQTGPRTSSSWPRTPARSTTRWSGSTWPPWHRWSRCRPRPGTSFPSRTSPARKWCRSASVPR